MPELLIETIPSTLRVLESNGGVPRKVGGLYQLANVENANKRVYRESLWRRVLLDPKTKEKIESRRMLGMLGHPSDGKTDLEKVSHLVTKLEMVGNKIYGEEEILNTPCGKILSELYRSGVVLGTSSRGSGELEDGPDGKKYVKDDYVLETFDHVLDPSTPGAYPRPLDSSVTKESADYVLAAVGSQLMTEGLDQRDLVSLKHIVESLSKHQDSSVSLKSTILSEDIDYRLSRAHDTPRPWSIEEIVANCKADTCHVWSPGTTFSQSTTHTSHAVKEESMELSNDVKILLEQQIKTEMTKLRQEYEAKAAGLVEHQEKTNSDLKDTKARLEAAEKLIGELNLRLKQQTLNATHFKEYIDGIGPVEARLEAAKKLTAEMVNRLKATSQLEQHYGAAVALLDELIGRVRGAKVESKIDQLLANESRAEEIRPMLEECTSPTEVQERYDQIKKLQGTKKPDPSLPNRETVKPQLAESVVSNQSDSPEKLLEEQDFADKLAQRIGTGV